MAIEAAGIYFFEIFFDINFFYTYFLILISSKFIFHALILMSKMAFVEDLPYLTRTDTATHGTEPHHTTLDAPLHLIPSNPIPSNLIQSNLVKFHNISYHIISSHPILFDSLIDLIVTLEIGKYLSKKYGAGHT